MTDDTLPPGWKLEKGAGGIRAVNTVKGWATAVYLDTVKGGPGKPRAIEAAVHLEKTAALTLEERERQCASLRKALRP